MSTRYLLSIRYLSLAIACAIAILPPKLAADEATNGTSASALKPAILQPDSKGQKRYIVRLESAPLALYRGDKAGMPATSPKITGERRFNPRSASSRRYQSYLEREQSAVLQTLRANLQRELPVLKRYSVALHGFLVELTPAEARRAAKLPGVAGVSPERLLKPQTDHGPRWIGAYPVWNGKASELPSRGEGIVIGIIDTGINAANPSFADIGADGYDHNNPEGRRFGVCNPADSHFDPDFACNDKLIGAYDFTETTPDNPFTALDVVGHGSHVAGIAAGNIVSSARLPAITFPHRLSGVAPHANLISYRVCNPGICSVSSIIEAIEQAILDGVDVINDSIGEDDVYQNAWDEDSSLAFLAAHAAGIVVANGAGNAGPDAATLGIPVSPWIMLVAASTHDRVISNGIAGLERNDGVTLPALSGKGLTAGYGPAAIAYAGHIPNPNDADGDSGLCAKAYPAGTFHGEIVVCDRGGNLPTDKSANILAGGAGGMVLVNVAGGAGNVATVTPFLPATHLGYADGQSLKDWLAQGSGHRGTILPYKITVDRSAGDVMASFSSRGPQFLPDLLSPDLTAPGVDILAPAGVNGEVVYEVFSGTSMASPHAAGSAALLKSLHPDWSPDEIKSALMTTAKTASLRDSDGKSRATPFDRGAGRINLAAAAQAGLVLDESFLHYIRANPAEHGDPSSLNLPSLAKNNCLLSGCSWQRRVRNPGLHTVNWSAAGLSTDGIQLTVNPANFTLAPGAGQTLDIRATATTNTKPGAWRFGQIALNADRQDVPPAHLPVAVRFIGSDLPRRLPLTGNTGMGTATLAVKPDLAVSRLSSRINGLVPAVLREGIIHQDEQLSFEVTVDKGTRRLVAEIRNSAAPKLMLLMHYHDNQGTAHILCRQAIEGHQEYCNIDNPAAGTYRIEVTGLTTSDPTGTQGDNFVLATGVLGNANRSNLQLVGSKETIPQAEAFDLKLDWDVDPTTKVWYGAFSLGTDTAHPHNLGNTNVDLYLD